MTPTERADIRLTNTAWEALLTSHSSLMSVYAAEDMWNEVSMGEYDVLYPLSKARHPLRLSELQHGVLLSQPALSRMVDRLVNRGILTREADADDRRAVRVSLTERGAQLQREVGRAHAKSVAREVGGALTREEIEELERLCTKLIQRSSSIAAGCA